MIYINICKEVIIIAKHSGGKVGKAGKVLGAKGSSKKQKSNAAKTLKEHQDTKH